MCMINPVAMRKVWVAEHSSLKNLFTNKLIYYRTKIINKFGEHLKIIEYPLILLFIISGAVFLMSTNDFISIFLSIELQSYGLYLLSTIYRNSELSTTGGLILATVRVYLELLARDSSVDGTKDYWPYPDMVTLGGQEPGLKGGVRHTVDTSIRCDAKRTLEVSDNNRIRLTVEDWVTLSWPRLALGFNFFWGILLLNWCRLAYWANSKSKTLRIALRTGYQKLSYIVNSAKYATGEVSSRGIRRGRDGRGFVVSTWQVEKGPKYLTRENIWVWRNSQVRSYATRSRKRKLVPVVELHKDFQILAKHWMTVHQNPSKIFKDLRGLLKLEYLWYASYIKIKRNKGSATPGPDSLTIDTLTRKRILEIRDCVLKKNYNWVGTKEVLIPKPGKPGKMRPLGIPAINDRLVQEVLRTVIEPIFEINFSNLSHGFRPNRGCHTALKWINTHMKDSVWFIEGDIKSYFPSVNHSILMKLIQKRVTDPNVLKLIRDGLKAEVFTKDKKSYEPELGTPQGGILSPLLSNIYLHEFDMYINELMSEHNTNAKPRRNPAIEKYYKTDAKKDIYRLKIPYYDPMDRNNIKIKYIRYADDFVIGITGSRELAAVIKDKIAVWLNDTLKITLSEEKTLITHISKGIHFLGYIFSRRLVFTKQMYGLRTLTRRMKIPTLDVDLGRVIKRLAEAGFCDKSGKPVPMFKYMQLPQSETNKKVNYIMQGLCNWWSIAGNRKRAVNILSYIMRSSLAKLYAAKFKLRTTAAVFKIAKNDLSRPIGQRAKSVIGVDEDGVPTNKRGLVGIKFAYYHTIPGCEGNKLAASWKPAYLKKLEESKDATELIHSLLAESLSGSKNPIARLGSRIKYSLSSQGAPCAVCGSTQGVEMHHTTPMKLVKEKDALKRHIKAINIKQIPLCRTHHLEAHGGNWRAAPKRK